MVSNQLSLSLTPLEYSLPQTAKRRLMVSGKTSVRFIFDDELSPCLTER